MTPEQAPTSEPQLVRWRPVDQKTPGITVEDARETTCIEWELLKHEIENRLLPQVRLVPLGSRVEMRDLGERKNWIVRVIDPRGVDVAEVWFGPDPDETWRWDGLVRVGSFHRPPKGGKIVWQTFQRYSDGSYRRIEAFAVSRAADTPRYGFPGT